MERRPDARPWELLDTVMRLKQGMGRLVRNDGLPKGTRRIYILDARLNDPGFKGYLSLIKRALHAYPNKILPYSAQNGGASGQVEASSAQAHSS